MCLSDLTTKMTAVKDLVIGLARLHAHYTRASICRCMTLSMYIEHFFNKALSSLMDGFTKIPQTTSCTWCLGKLHDMLGN